MKTNTGRHFQSLSILIGYANSPVEPTNDCKDLIKVFKNTKPQIKMETIPCMPNFQMGLLCWKGLLITLHKMIFTNKCEAKKCWETKIKKRTKKKHANLTNSRSPCNFSSNWDFIASKAFLEGDSLIPNEVDLLPLKQLLSEEANHIELVRS